MYTNRFYKDESDYQKMRHLLIESFPQMSPPLNCLLGEIDWWSSATNDSTILNKVKLWFEGEKLIAFVWPKGNEAEVMIHPDFRQNELEIFKNFQADFLNAFVATNDAPKPIFHFWSYDTDEYRNNILKSLNYKRVDDEYLVCFEIDLSSLSGKLNQPFGYTLRSFDGETEIQNRVDAHISAFHPSKMTIEKYRNLMGKPTYRKDFDLVCVDRNLQIAAFTTIWIDEVNQVAIFEPVGCHSDHQRKGLGKAVMSYGLFQLEKQGIKKAFVMAHTSESAGAKLYQSLGFRILGNLFQWKRAF